MLVLEIYIEKTANDAHNMIPIRATNDQCECRFMAIVIVEFYPGCPEGSRISLKRDVARQQ